MTSTQDDDKDKKYIPNTHIPDVDDEHVLYSALFTKKIFRKLQDLAKMKGVTIERALGDAIDLSKWLNDEREEGNKILIERKNKKLREVMVL